MIRRESRSPQGRQLTCPLCGSSALRTIYRRRAFGGVAMIVALVSLFTGLRVARTWP